VVNGGQTFGFGASFGFGGPSKGIVHNLSKMDRVEECIERLRSNTLRVCDLSGAVLLCFQRRMNRLVEFAYFVSAACGIEEDVAISLAVALKANNTLEQLYLNGEPQRFRSLSAYPLPPFIHVDAWDAERTSFNSRDEHGITPSSAYQAANRSLSCCRMLCREPHWRERNYGYS
jgi:hypothetical protein